ncbi:terminase small subunit [Microcella alkaliphila]|uniref:Terminase small subunit actinomycetes phage-type domain-containing protein n=1 Tax=Microcella alkaliphila TaxID=279828 RepID=A0A0U4NW28_9MICO|nr:hypothetical protein [Microcella alkaliphila]BAU32467.1 uncharacterized protein MalAC0309_1616 [Microcella alkaliphila]
MPQTEEQRKAAARERARKYRQKKAAEREAARQAERDERDAEAPRTMRESVRASLEAMKWLVDSDVAAVLQAKMLAEQIDLMTHAGETTKALSAHRALTTVLDRLGGTPTVRMQHELRSLRMAAKTEGGKDGDEGADTPPNVSRFERPKRRRRSS